MSSRWNSAQGSGMALAFWTACFHASCWVRQARNADFWAHRVCYDMRSNCREFEFAGINGKRDGANSTHKWTSGQRHTMCMCACVKVWQNGMTAKTVYSEEVMWTVCQVWHVTVNESALTGQHASKWKVGKTEKQMEKKTVYYNLIQQANCFKKWNTLLIWLSFCLLFSLNLLYIEQCQIFAATSKCLAATWQGNNSPFLQEPTINHW